MMKEHKKKGDRATLAFYKLHTDSATFIMKDNSVNVKRIEKGHQTQRFRQQSQHQSQPTYENHKISVSATQAVNKGHGSLIVQDDTRSLNPFHNLTSTTTANLTLRKIAI